MSITKATNVPPNGMKNQKAGFNRLADCPDRTPSFCIKGRFGKQQKRKEMSNEIGFQRRRYDKNRAEFLKKQRGRQQYTNGFGHLKRFREMRSE
jgi:hypothetical protein